MITQIIYDINKNTKVTVSTYPNASGDDDITGRTTGGVTKFYPVDTKETMEFKLQTIVNIPHKRPQRTYVYSASERQRTSAIYTVLNEDCRYKDFNHSIIKPALDNNRIILGDVPNIATITQPHTAEDTILQQFGLVVKGKHYNKILDAIASDIKENLGGRRRCERIGQVSTNRSQRSLTIFSRGSIVAGASDFLVYSDNGGYVKGYEYKLRGMALDSYNHIRIPTKTKTTINKKHNGLLPKPLIETEGEGGYTEKSFATSIKTTTTNSFYYGGGQPLKSRIKNDTWMYGKTFIDPSNFKVIMVLDQNDNFQQVLIANRDYWHNKNGHGVRMVELTDFNYDYRTFYNIYFYQLASQIKSRYEWCLVAELDNTKVIYPCSKGTGQQSGLSQLISYMDVEKRDKLIEDAPLVEESTAGVYYTSMSGDMRKLIDLQHQNKQLCELNYLAKVKFKFQRLERSIVSMQPHGKNLSWQRIQSERVGELTHDYDSKEMAGGALNYQTRTVPTYNDWFSYGSGVTIKPVGYNGVTYKYYGDLKTVARNFWKQNNDLHSLSIAFKGEATYREFMHELDFDESTFVLDKINWDIGKNTTTYSGRVVIQQ